MLRFLHRLQADQKFRLRRISTNGQPKSLLFRQSRSGGRFSLTPASPENVSNVGHFRPTGDLENHAHQGPMTLNGAMPPGPKRSYENS